MGGTLVSARLEGGAKPLGDNSQGNTMYLEISARQSGKTTRLIAAVCSHVSSNGTAAVFAHTQKRAQELHMMINQAAYFGVSGAVYMFTTLTQFERWLRGQRIRDLALFYDEFDLFDPADVLVEKHGYYVGTPTYERTCEQVIQYALGKRTDPLFELIRTNKQKLFSFSTLTRQQMNPAI